MSPGDTVKVAASATSVSATLERCRGRVGTIATPLEDGRMVVDFEGRLVVVPAVQLEVLTRKVESNGHAG